MIDPNNPIVQLCSAGIQAEFEDRIDAARALFEQAWSAAHDDYEACIAAHYLARHQPTPQQTLAWNREALARALAVGDERVAGWYPSLYLNVAHSYDVLGNHAEAQRFYELAATSSKHLPDDAYSATVRQAIRART